MYLLGPELAIDEFDKVVIADGQGQVRLEAFWSGSFTHGAAPTLWSEIQRPFFSVNLEHNKPLRP